VHYRYAGGILKKSVGIILIAITLLAYSTIGESETSIRGTIVEVNTSSKTIALRAGRNVFRFDAVRPILSGYGSLYSIRVGDTVAVAYVKEGLKIDRINALWKGKKDGRGFIRHIDKDLNIFENADENKDGRVTPVEVSAFMPDLTMEQFKQYDAKGDGYLDKTEFNQLIRALKR
jgi:hypothetical protein